MEGFEQGFYVRTLIVISIYLPEAESRPHSALHSEVGMRNLKSTCHFEGAQPGKHIGDRPKDSFGEKS